VHRGCKGNVFTRDFCVLQNAFIKPKPRKQEASGHSLLQNHPRK